MTNQTQPNPIRLQRPAHNLTLVDPRALRFENYITISELEIPTIFDWTTKKDSPWGIKGNWELPCCLCSAAAHMIECWTSNATGEVYVNDNAVLNAYIALTGYDPVTRQNATFIAYDDLLKHWRTIGIGDHKIKAYTTVDHTQPDSVRACIYAFGGAFVGLDLPKNLDKDADIWDVAPGDLTGDNAPGSGHGHAIAVLGYDEQYITCVTYGEEKKMTWDFWRAYSCLLYAVISEDFFNGEKTAHGFDIATLQADLIEITSEKARIEQEILDFIAPPEEPSKPPRPDAITTANAITIGNLQVMAMDIGRMDWVDAVIACEALGDGWRLPTKDELNLVYLQKDKIGRFHEDDFGYWSSTHNLATLDNNEDDGLRYYQLFTDGSQLTSGINEGGDVRAVRDVPENQY